MTNKDLLNLVTKYNEEKDEILDRCTDILIRQFYDALDALHIQGKWGQVLEATAIGYTVAAIEPGFTAFNESNFLMEQQYINKKTKNLIWLFYEYDDSVEFFEEMGTLIRFKKVIDEEIYKTSKDKIFDIIGFDNNDIYKLSPFIEKMEEKGFRCFVNTDDQRLLIVLDIK